MNRKSKLNVDEVDWSLQNCEIADIFKVCPATVSSFRFRHGIPKPKNHRLRTMHVRRKLQRLEREVQKVGLNGTFNYSQCLKIGRRTHSSFSNTLHWLRKLGYKYTPENQSHDYSSVDWRQQDTIIAKQIGVSRERVRQVRQESNLPKAENHRRHLEQEKIENERWSLIEKVMKEQSTTSRKIISASTGIAYPAVLSLMKRHSVPKDVLCKFGDPRKWNWDLPNVVLQKVHKISTQNYVSRLRRLFGRKAKIDARTIEGRETTKKLMAE